MKEKVNVFQADPSLSHGDLAQVFSTGGLAQVETASDCNGFKLSTVLYVLDCISCCTLLTTPLNYDILNHKPHQDL